MPMFEYKALSRDGKELKKTLNAESIIHAKSKIKADGLMLVQISEKNSASTKKNASSFQIGSGVSVDDLGLMTRQLSTLVRAKIQIVEALSALQDQVDNEVLRMVLSEVKQEVNEGSSLAKAFSKHPKIFNHVYVNMVEAGEESGNLEIVLLRLAEFTEAQMKLLAKIKGAMTYPMIMIVVSFSIISLIFVFVIPKITDILINMRIEIPLPTRICIGISNFLISWGWWVLPFLFAFLYILFNRWKKSPSGKSHWHRLMLKLPLFGPIIKMINVARFSSTLSTLLSSGVPILLSLKIVKNLISNIHMQEAIEKSIESVSQGRSMAIPLKESGDFPTMVTHMITLGEKSGEVEEMLGIIAETYEDQVNNKISSLTSFIEPLMIIFMGGTVFFIVLSVILPLLKMNQIR